VSEILIKNGTLITMNPEREIIKADILIKDDCIKNIGKRIQVKPSQIIDASGLTIIPGLIQTHTHLTQTLFRGLADDLELLDWLKKRIWPLEAAHTFESNSISARLGIAELILGGTTSIIDMGTVHHTQAIAEAVRDTGYRAIIGKCMMDHGNDVPPGLMENSSVSLDESVRLMETWHQSAQGRIDYAFAPRFVVSCTEELLLNVKEIASKNDLLVHTHASENRGEIALVEKERGMRNIKYLRKLGLTGKNLLLAHCIWLDDEEMNILSKTGTKVSHCPSSNLKLASGIAKIPELLKMNASLSLGSDGAPCNNNLSMFTEMRHAALIQKVRLLSPTALPAYQVFEMATLGGAKVMGKDHELGSLEPGKKADIVLVDLNKIHTSPGLNRDPISQLVYSATAQDVHTTIINGKIVMQNRKVETIDVEQTIKEANQICEQLLNSETIRSLF